VSTNSGASIAAPPNGPAPQPPPARHAPPWIPVWSRPAALRAVRATLVVPGLFAICYQVIGNLQMATFAAFGGFGTLLFASFGGNRRDKLAAHFALAMVGSVLLIIGTAVNSSTAVAALVTLPVAFLVLFAGVAGPTAASGGTAALLAYVLPAASPGTMGMVPDRLAGWWMASAAGTLAVLLLSPKSPANRLRASAAATADALSEQLAAALRGTCTADQREATVAAKHSMLEAFTATPWRPTGLATPDQALSSLVGLLEWCTAVVCDSLREYTDLRSATAVERNLLAITADVLRDIAALLRGEVAEPDLALLEGRLTDSIAHLSELHGGQDDYGEAVHLSFHARTVAMAVQTAAADALVTSRKADPRVVAQQRRRWVGASADAADAAAAEGPFAALAGAGSITRRQTSLRSAWFLSSVRGAVALAAAVAVADLTGVQHGFWVVLGTLSVLRTNAAATGATAMRALLGTAAGFVIGAALLLAIGSGSTALWIALPIAVAIAAYTPGVAPFAAGQAAFTVVVSVLFNLLVPAGWKIGVLRVEDVALGCAVSLCVGVLFWPRGAAAVVGNDLADSFRSGSRYLTHAVDWALGARHDSPDAAPAVIAALRLDDALRGFLAEQGTKKIPKEHLWRLVGGAMRLRLTAYSLAGLPSPSVDLDPARDALGAQAELLAAWYERLATQLGSTEHADTTPLAPPVDGPYPADGVPAEHLSCTLWVGEHLRHLTAHLTELTEPAAEIANRRSAPWWR
jgi:uncharacterized membrane protein YccC